MSSNFIWTISSGELYAAKETGTETAPPEKPHGEQEFDPVKPDGPMFFLTWGIFLALLLVLYKLAWKPILTGLNEREDKIRQSLDDAEKASQELKEVQETTKKLLQEAEVKAKDIVSQARETAQSLGKEIEEKAKADAQTTRDNALKDIESAKVEAMESLKKVSTELAIELAGKLLGENLDNEKNRALTDKLINKI